MSKLQLGLVVSTAVTSVAISLVIRHHAGRHEREMEEALREQAAQYTVLETEHARLSGLLAEKIGSSEDNPRFEVTKLRREAEALRKEAAELGKRQINATESHQKPPVEEQNSTSSAEYKAIQQANTRDALYLTTGCLQYAWEHTNEVPSDLTQVAEYLRKGKLSLTGTNDFDIVYQGSLDELTNIPRGDVALIRGRRTWRGPDGEDIRAYGMAGGFSLTVASDDNFKSWEAEHIVPSTSSRQ